jgi:hypothetical protein
MIFKKIWERLLNNDKGVFSQVAGGRSECCFSFTSVGFLVIQHSYLLKSLAWLLLQFQKRTTFQFYNSDSSRTLRFGNVLDTNDSCFKQ